MALCLLILQTVKETDVNDLHPLDLLRRPPLQVLCNVSCSTLGIVCQNYLQITPVSLPFWFFHTVSARYLEQDYGIEHKTV